MKIKDFKTFISFSGDYNDLTNKPNLDTKQNTLVSGSNIKTINNSSILGSGDLTVEGVGGLTQPQILARTLGC